MKINRRGFIKTAGGIALASIAVSIPALSSSQQPSGGQRQKRRVAVFFEPTFPSVDFEPIGRESLQKALDGVEVVFFGVNDLKNQLNAHDHDVLITPYGSAFPKAAYSALSKFLVDGGNWVNLGGIPFSVPVVKEGYGWRKEIRQTVYHKNLGVTQAFPVSAQPITSYQTNELLEGVNELLGEFTAEEIYELYVRFTVTKDFPSEDGSAGPRDAVLRPLLFGLNS
ncbi:MAG: hypothetical protein AABZ61_06885, partial [Bacteroidota bacterium]